MQQQLTFRGAFAANESLTRLRYRFEQRIGVLLKIVAEASGAVLIARFVLAGATWQFEFRPVGMRGTDRIVLISATIDWSRFAHEYDDYFRKSAAAWFEYWTSEVSALSLEELCEQHARDGWRDWGELLADEKSQQALPAILERLEGEVRAGAWLSFNDKEGETRFDYSGNRFRRSSQGEHSPGYLYDSAADCFLEASQLMKVRLLGGDNEASADELAAWKMLLRWLQR